MIIANQYCLAKTLVWELMWRSLLQIRIKQDLMQGIMKRLYFGDNLQVLRENINSESVDLVYLDPPFNSNADYNVIFGGRKSGDAPPQAQITAFEDTWHWSDESARTLQALDEVNGDLAEILPSQCRIIHKSEDN